MATFSAKSVCPTGTVVIEDAKAVNLARKMESMYNSPNLVAIYDRCC